MCPQTRPLADENIPRGIATSTTHSYAHSVRQFSSAGLQPGCLSKCGSGVRIKPTFGPFSQPCTSGRAPSGSMAQIVRIPVQRLLSGDASVQADIAKASLQHAGHAFMPHTHMALACAAAATLMLCCAARLRMGPWRACMRMHARAGVWARRPGCAVSQWRSGLRGST